MTLLLALLALASGGFAALREWRRLKLLSRAIAVQSPHAVAFGASEDHTLIVVRDDRPFAFCHGMLRPRIYYSTELARLLTDAELKAVLLHEKLHARRRDPLRVFMAHTLAAMFFFFPLVRVMRERYLVWLEVSADQEVVRHLGVAVLARALLKLLQPSSPLQVKAVVSQINPTEERIRRLTSPDASVPGPIILRRHSLATLALTAGTGFMAVGIVNSVSALLLSMQFCQIPIT